MSMGLFITRTDRNEAEKKRLAAILEEVDKRIPALGTKIRERPEELSEHVAGQMLRDKKLYGRYPCVSAKSQFMTEDQEIWKNVFGNLNGFKWQFDHMRHRFDAPYSQSYLVAWVEMTQPPDVWEQVKQMRDTLRTRSVAQRAALTTRGVLVGLPKLWVPAGIPAYPRGTFIPSGYQSMTTIEQRRVMSERLYGQKHQWEPGCGAFEYLLSQDVAITDYWAPQAENQTEQIASDLYRVSGLLGGPEPCAIRVIVRCVAEPTVPSRSRTSVILDWNIGVEDYGSQRHFWANRIRDAADVLREWAFVTKTRKQSRGSLLPFVDAKLQERTIVDFNEMSKRIEDATQKAAEAQIAAEKGEPTIDEKVFKDLLFELATKGMMTIAELLISAWMHQASTVEERLNMLYGFVDSGHAPFLLNRLQRLEVVKDTATTLFGQALAVRLQGSGSTKAKFDEIETWFYEASRWSTILDRKTRLGAARRALQEFAPNPQDRNWRATQERLNLWAQALTN